MTTSEEDKRRERGEVAPGARQGSGESPDGRRTRIGLVTDPDFPQRVAEDLATTLPAHLSDDRSWSIEVEVEPVTAGRQDSGQILVATRDRLQRHGWDFAICVTDLPVRVDHRPVLSEANIDEHVAVISLPTLGGGQPYRRARQLVAQVLDELAQATVDGSRDGSEPRHGLQSPLTVLLAPIHREKATEESEADVRFVASKRRGRLRLLTGMVRTNQPWRLVFGLSSALAAAVATSAFGLSSSTIWQIGDRLGTTRQVVAAVASVAILVFWLIVAHHLWEKRPKNTERDREQVLLYNTSTVLTLAIGVGCMYLGLFAVNLGVAYFLVTPGLLSGILGHPVGVSTYLTLAWGFTTMGVVAGALGSSLESDKDVRQAAYGYREQQRRAELQRESERQREPG